MIKAELRRLFLAKRMDLTTDAVEHWSQLLTGHFFDFLARTDLADKFALIHTFLPIRRQNEVNTWLIINMLWQAFPLIQVAVSLTDPITNQLTHYPLSSNTTLLENRWGIPEPINSDRQSTIANDQLDVVLIPLLAFDKQGHRVGYGGGYYDRFLAECRPNCLKIGLSFFEPIDHIDAIEPTDIKLDVCITPLYCYSFK